MNAQFLGQIDEHVYSNPANRLNFFGKTGSDAIRNSYEIKREMRAVGSPGSSCDVNLFLGFFFDGTGNNYDLSTKAKDFSHANVARLYGAYPGQGIPGVPADENAKWTTDPAGYEHFFKVYVPGVGTPFERVGDSGEGFFDYTGGRAAARFGERRIIWALVQAINCVHRYLTKSPAGYGLFGPEETLDFCKRFDLDWGASAVTSMYRSIPRTGIDTPASRNRRLLSDLLGKLHASIKPHMIDPATGQCQKVDPGRVKNVFASAFGFSRGAAEARAFTNWFRQLCALDAQMSRSSAPYTLGSFPVTFDFLGLFDTVASVGLAASSLFADGHTAWADSEHSLRIPDDVPCLHIVAAHEFRRSFPLDSAHVGHRLPAQTREWVCPGMHSDVGGGYQPKEQGKGFHPQGADMLSRISLALMYREARLSGVPLKLELASPVIKDQFAVSKDLIREFNAYIDLCKRKEGTLHDLMAEQRELYIRWRKTWAGQIEQAPFTQRASPADRADLISADAQFAIEVRDFEVWCQRRASHAAAPRYGRATIMAASPPKPPGIDPERAGEWERIKPYWTAPPPHPAICTFFDQRIHDAHAWFKLTGLEAAHFEREIRKLIALRNANREALARGADAHNLPRIFPKQLAWIELYERTGEFHPQFTEGREMYRLGAGYLRYRRVYAGADDVRLTQQVPLRTPPVDVTAYG